MKFISILPKCILNSPSGKLVKTERNVKFISTHKHKKAQTDPSALSLSYSLKLLLCVEEILSLVSLNEEFSEDVSSGLR